MTEDEYRDKVREALVEGLLSCNGAACNDETKRVMMERMIEVMPAPEPIQWVESAKIENGTFRIKLTQRATELLRQQGWEEVTDGPQNAGD